MLTFYEYAAIFLALAAVGGEFIVSWTKKLLLGPSSRHILDISGAVERMLLVMLIYAGGQYVLLVPFIIVIRWLMVISGMNAKKFADIIKRMEPAVEFQKIRLKSEMTINLLASPVMGVLFGIIARFL